VQAVAFAGEREEVVPVEDYVHTEFFRFGDRPANLLVLRVLRLELQPYPHWP
jgi:hypothetical protein